MGTEYYVVSEMSVCDMISHFEVYVNGTKVGDYSIANYIEGLNSGVAKALWGYGVAARNYKLS